MGKKKRRKQVIPLDVERSIQHVLRVTFHCTEQEIELIGKALHGMVPHDVAGHLQDIHDDKVPLPLVKPSFALEVEEGKVENLTLNTHHPLSLLYDFLQAHYGGQDGYNKKFSGLYWAAITSPHRPKDYLDFLKLGPQGEEAED